MIGIPTDRLRAASLLAVLGPLLLAGLAPHAGAEDFGVLFAATEMVHPAYHLRVAGEDLQRMREAFVRGLGIPESRLSVLSGEALSRQNVEEVFWNLRRRVQGPRGDRVFVYFSGHGAKAPRADERTAARAFLLYTARPPERGNAFHPLHTFTEDDLKDWLAPIREAGVRTVLFLDCDFAPAPGTKSAGLAGAPMAEVPFEAVFAADMELSAAVPGGAAFPREGGGGSLFTYHLAETLLDVQSPRMDADTLAARVQQAMQAEREDAIPFYHPARAGFGAALVIDRTVGVVVLPVVTFDGAPLAGVEVVEDEPAGKRRSLGRTDPQGRLRLKGRARALAFRLSKRGYLETPGTLTIVWGETQLEPVRLLPDYVWIDGQVSDEGGAPVAGASVRLTGSSIDDFIPGFHQLDATTGLDGRFSLRVRPGRSYRLRARSGSAISPTVTIHGGKPLEASRYVDGELHEQRYAPDQPLQIPGDGGKTPSRRSYEESVRRGREFFDGGHFASARAYFEFARDRAPDGSLDEVEEWLRRCAIAEKAQEIRQQMDEAFGAERYGDVRRHWSALERLLEDEGQNLGSRVVARFSEGVLGPGGMLHRALDEDIPAETRRAFEAAQQLDESGDLVTAAARYAEARKGANESYLARIDERLKDLNARIEDTFQEDVRKGRAALRAGDAPAAKEWAAEALRLRPGEPLALALQEDADREDVAPEVKASVIEGERKLAGGEPEAAASAFQRALASKTNRFYRIRAEDGLLRASKAASRKWQDVARDRTLQGDTAGAAEAWEQVLQYDPGFPPALAALAALGRKAEVRESRAFARIRRWFQYEGDDPEQIREGIEELRQFRRQFPEARHAPQVERALRRLEQRPEPARSTDFVADETLPGQGRDEVSGLALRVRLAADPTIVLCLIPTGECVLGDERGEGDADERPARRVRFEHPFYLSLTEVTWGQYLRYCEESGIKPPPAPPWGILEQHPVVQVSWSEARSFCRSRGGRLPTEAEWEYAAKAGSSTRYSWGDEIDPSRGNFDASQRRRTTPAGHYPFGASRMGPLDMAGNVWEWCEDWYDPAWYATLREAAVAGSGPISGSQRVLRGGSWSDPDSACRAANRHGEDPETRSDLIGFRIAADVRRDRKRPEEATPAGRLADAGLAGVHPPVPPLAERPPEAPPEPLIRVPGAGQPPPGGEVPPPALEAGRGSPGLEAVSPPPQASIPRRSEAATRIDPVTQDVTHVVQEGETLVSIARKFYGRPRYAASIARRNGIHSIDQVVTGLELVLPRIPGVAMNLEGAETLASPSSGRVAPAPGGAAVAARGAPEGTPPGGEKGRAVPAGERPGEAAAEDAVARAPGGGAETPREADANAGKVSAETHDRPGVRTASGLTYVDQVLGTGVVALPGNTVVVHYEGMLEDGTRIDSTRGRGQPLEFRLGTQAVIQGLDEGVIGMRAGGKRHLIVPPDLAFGAKGIAGLVPANATVLFDVELITVR